MEIRVATATNRTNGSPARGRSYKFDPPIEVDCMCTGGIKSGRKRFAEGLCTTSQLRGSSFVFYGKPVGEEAWYYFFVEWNAGSVAKLVLPPYLRLVK